MKKKVAFYTLGCKLNFSETSTIARSFADEGFERVDFSEKADMYVINTCSVTDNADKKFKTIVKKAQKINADAFVAAVGCYAQLKPKKISSFHGVNKVLGIKEKFEFKNYLSSKKKIIHQDIKETKDFNLSYSIGDRTRSFLKIQDGCNFSCSFCTIPMARGRSRSTGSEEVIIKIKE